MTSVIAPESLDWVTFSDGDDACDWRGGCPSEAVAVARWRHSCDHMAASTRVCIRHRDRVLEVSRDAARHFACSTCTAVFYLDRMEPIR